MPDQTAKRMFTLQGMLKYKPPGNMSDPSSFRQDLVTGSKPVIHSILHWLLQRITELKKRAYLARFLVKLEVPAEFPQGGVITDTDHQDIGAMEEEKDQLIKRVERLKKRVESVFNHQRMLELARQLHVEKEREVSGSAEEPTFPGKAETAEISAAAEGPAAGSSRFQTRELEEEIKFNSYMVSDKLPKELESKRWMVQYLQKVVSKPDMSQAELRELEDKIRENNIEINQLTEKRMMRNDPMDDKLSLQAAGENSQARDLEGDEVIRGDEFKRFVGNLCSKGAVFKKKRQEIRSEYGVLQRTEEILKQSDPWRHRSGSLGTVTLRRNWRGCRPSRVNWTR